MSREQERETVYSPVCKAKGALVNPAVNYAGRAEKFDVWLNVVKFSTTKKDSTSELYQVVVKGCNRSFVTIT